MMKVKKIFWLILIITVLLSIIIISTNNIYSSTNQFRGVNWADQRDNFVDGVLYVSGLSSSDNYSSASVVADRVVGQFMSLLDSNTVRMPVNEATVSNYWNVYTGAIDTALSKGKVILAYWAYSGGKPANMNNYWNMWNTIVNTYGNNGNCYFEPINEPYGYNSTDLCNLYNDWCTRFSGVSKGRILLDGAGYAEDIPPVGSDSRLSDCLLAVHDYAFWTTHNTEAQWQTDLSNSVGNYTDRVVMTEWGASMTTGKNYNVSSSDNEVCYIRGISSLLRSWGAGSCYWPGLRDDDSYSITRKSGSGSNIVLSVTNLSGRDRLIYAWGDAPTPTSISGICGDVNSNGQTDIADALLIAQYYVGANPQLFDRYVADVNGDGNINIQDALLVSQYYVGILNTLSCN